MSAYTLLPSPSLLPSPTLLPGSDEFEPPVSQYLWRPTLQDIESLMPARSDGRWTSGDTDTEFPDEIRVNRVIDLTTSAVASAVGGLRLPEKFYESAKACAVLLTAMWLEPAAWPEQARPDKSAWDQWKALYDMQIEALVSIIAKDAQDGDTGDGGPETTSWLPAGGFPCPGLPVRGMIAPGTYDFSQFGPGGLVADQDF